MNEMHPTMARLYEAAVAGQVIEGKYPQAELARAMNTSSQRVKNWQSRGVSKEGVIEALQALGISLNWVMYAELPMLTRDAPSTSVLAPLPSSHNVRSTIEMVTLAARMVLETIKERQLDVPPSEGAELIAAVYEDMISGQSLEAAKDVVRGMLRAFSVRGQHVTD